MYCSYACQWGADGAIGPSPVLKPPQGIHSRQSFLAAVRLRNVQPSVSVLQTANRTHVKLPLADLKWHVNVKFSLSKILALTHKASVTHLVHHVSN